MNEELDIALMATSTSHPDLFTIAFGTALSDDNRLGGNMGINNRGNNTTTTFSTTNNSNDEEYTQIVSIFGFSALVIVAIFAWLFSRHCCFKEKAPLPGGEPAVRRSPRSRPQQFNFLGVQVIRRLGSISTASIRSEEPPPSYNDLFPAVVIVPNPQPPETPPIPGPAPPYTESNKTDLSDEATIEPKES